jgi:ferredoxin
MSERTRHQKYRAGHYCRVRGLSHSALYGHEQLPELHRQGLHEFLPVRRHFHVENNRAKIDPDKCRECGMCAKACPFNAIADLERPCKKNCPVNAITMDEDGLCVIDESKCIQCGVCVHSCPFNAIGAKTFLVDVIRMILDGKKVIAMVAPATEGPVRTGHYHGFLADRA